MTELKTLKDLNDYGMSVIDTFKNELKAEAVKWFKDFKIGHNIREDKIINIEEFIKHFFNLTKEDLGDLE